MRSHIHTLTHSTRCPECGSNRLYEEGLRYTNEGQVQRFLCRVCSYRFSQPNVKVNVAGKVVESSNSGKNHHEVRVASGYAAYEKVYYGLSFSLGEDVGSHTLSIVEIT